MADEQRAIELPARNQNLSVHEDVNVTPRSDTGRIDLTTPKVTQPETTVSPDKPEEKELPKEEAKEVEAPKDEDLETLKRKRKELEEDNYKYRERSRRDREEKEELKTRLDRLESLASSVNGDRELDEQSKKVQAELGIDEEAAKKLTRAFREINKPKSEPQLNPVQKAAKEFSESSMEAMEDFPDWEANRQKMTELLQADIQSSGELKALKRGPLYYYSESKRLSQGDPESAKAEGRKEMAQKVSQKNLSVSESSRNSQGKPVAPSVWTREKVQELARNNPDEYAKRRPEIMKAMNSGEIQ